MRRFLASSIEPGPAPSNPEDAMKEALLAVVQVWLDRLQTMSVVTTFFVSIDGMLYGLSARNPDMSQWTLTETVITACLGGSIILHVCASILAYIASFLLIRFRLAEAQRQEEAAEHALACGRPSGEKPLSALGLAPSTLGLAPAALEPGTLPPRADVFLSSTPTRADPWDAYTDLRSLISVHQVRPFAFASDALARAFARPRRGALVCAAFDAEVPPSPAGGEKGTGAGGRMGTGARGGDSPDAEAERAVAALRSMVRTLSRCHTLTGALALVGFVLALVGALGYFWTGLPMGLGIFASVCLGGSLVAGAVAMG